jgi:hypothetical protein
MPAAVTIHLDIDRLTKGAIVSRKTQENEPQVLGLIGVGLDNSDGHKRLTECEDFLVVGGSQETHEMMQDVAIRFSEKLHDRGKRLQDASLQEVVDILHRAIE